jgi:hypothetical protein
MKHPHGGYAHSPPGPYKSFQVTQAHAKLVPAATGAARCQQVALCNSQAAKLQQWIFIGSCSVQNVKMLHTLLRSCCVSPHADASQSRNK